MKENNKQLEQEIPYWVRLILKARNARKGPHPD